MTPSLSCLQPVPPSLTTHSLPPPHVTNSLTPDHHSPRFARVCNRIPIFDPVPSLSPLAFPPWSVHFAHPTPAPTSANPQPLDNSLTKTPHATGSLLGANSLGSPA